MKYILVIISIICLTCAFVLWTKAKQLKVQKSEKQQEYEKQLKNLQSAINGLNDEKLKLLSEINERKKDIDQEYEREKSRIDEQVQLYKNNSDYASEQYIACLEKQYAKAEQKYDAGMQKIKDESLEVQNSLQKLRDALAAGMRAQLREQEKEDNINFYKIVISDNDISDIKMLNNLKQNFHQPVVISKLIWSTYFQKKVSELCSRVLGTKTVCGIYKITNLKTQQCYIGQSVNVGA